MRLGRRTPLADFDGTSVGFGEPNPTTLRTATGRSATCEPMPGNKPSPPSMRPSRAAANASTTCPGSLGVSDQALHLDFQDLRHVKHFASGHEARHSSHGNCGYDALMNNILTFRVATQTDIPAMSRIRLAVTENVLSNPARITNQMYEDYLEKLGRGWVAESSEGIVGFAYACRADGSVWALFVQPGEERRGAARGMMNLLNSWLFSIGHDSIRLGTEANTRADRFYQAQGWKRGAMIDSVEVEYTLEREAWMDLQGIRSGSPI